MKTAIKKMLTLICREYWEHKILMLWLPLAATLLTLILQLGAALPWGSGEESVVNLNYTVNTEEGQKSEKLTGDNMLQLLLNRGREGEPISAFEASLTGFTLVIVCLLIIALLIYTHSSFYGDRSRKEILFWRSMPVSELQNLFSKLLVICIIMPAIYSFMLLIYGLGNFIRFPEAENLMLVGIKVSNLTLTAILFTLIFLPLISWILACSAAAKRSPVFLSLLMPLALGLVLRLALGQNYISSGVRHYFADVWAQVKGGPETLQQQLGFLVSTEFLPGLLVSVLLLATCVWLRNNRYEI